MKSAKVFLGIFLVIFFLFVLPVSLIAQNIELGIAWEGKSGMAERILAGMERALNENAPQITLDIRKELADVSALEGVVSEFEQTKNGMAILRSSGTQLLGSRDLTIPSFVGGTNNPVQLGAATTLSQPKPNLSGVTYYIPAKIKLETFMQVYPAMKNYLLLVEEGHPGSPIDADETAEAAPLLGLNGRIVFCSNLEDAIEAIKGAEQDVSIILGSQAMLFDKAMELVEAAGVRPVFSYSQSPVEVGALCGVVADDDKLGYMLGMMVIEVLVKGTSVRELGIQTDPQPKLYLNSKTIVRLNLQVPYSILSLATIIE
jgi:putative ABC transport system substrate-binding protein